MELKGLLVVTTMHQPYYLAHQALVVGLHGRGLLEHELRNLLRGASHEIAMTFIDGQPVCVALLTEYGQLMVYTRHRYRRLGLGRRTVRLLSRRTRTALHLMLGGVGRNPSVSRGFFEAVGVELSDDYHRGDS